MEGLIACFDVRKVVRALDEVGATSVRILEDRLRNRLIAEADTYAFTEQPKIAASGKVVQQLSSFDQFPPHSSFGLLARSFQDILMRKFTTLRAEEYPFQGPLNLNDMVLQRYKPGPIGISPHVDGKSRINVVCCFFLEGIGRFCVCEDRSGSNPVEIPSPPGNVLLMCAPGFRRCVQGPFHFVSDIQTPRLTFGLRQYESK